MSFIRQRVLIISSIVYSADATLYLACVVDELTGSDPGFFLGAHSFSFVSVFFFQNTSCIGKLPGHLGEGGIVFLVFMLRHKIPKSNFNRPAKLSMSLGVR